MPVREELAPVIDPLVWVREIDRFVRGKGRHTLSTTCKRWKVEVKGAHDALADCRMTWELARKVLDRNIVPSDPIVFFERQVCLSEEQDRRYRAYISQKNAEKHAVEGSR